WLFFGLHLLSLAATFALLIRLARLWSDTDMAGLLAALLFVVVRISPAGEPTTDAAFYTRSAALPPALAALLLLWRRRPYAGFGLLILTLLIHSLTAFYASVIGITVWLLNPGWHGHAYSLARGPARRLPLVLFLGAAALCA